jgi:hypothetical protein
MHDHVQKRAELLHIATIIFKAGIPTGRVNPMASEDPYYTPKQAVNVAIELIGRVDDYIVGCPDEEPDQSSSG